MQRRMRKIDKYVKLEDVLSIFDEMEPFEGYEAEHALWLDLRIEILNAKFITVGCDESKNDNP